MQFAKLFFVGMATLAAAGTLHTTKEKGLELVECCGDGTFAGTCCANGYDCGCPACPCAEGKTPQYVGSTSSKKHTLTHNGAGDFGLRDNPDRDE